MIEKSFTDVVNDIRCGEIWCSDFTGIEKTIDSNIVIFKIDEESGRRCLYNNIEVVMPKDEKFILHSRKSFTIEKAMIAYMNGNTIQSLSSEVEYSPTNGYLDGRMSIAEILGEWYIND